MRLTFKIFTFFLILILFNSCVSKKKFITLQNDLEIANNDLGKLGNELNSLMAKLSTCEMNLTEAKATSSGDKEAVRFREEQIRDLKNQIKDCQKQRDQQVTQVGDLTVLSQSANENIKETLGQLEKRDKYIRHLQNAKTKADSINLALAINLKDVLKDGIDDQDIEIKVDKTVVFVNLSDKMLFSSGSANIKPQAKLVLGKIAKIVASKPDVEVMVEGYTDNVPMKNNCLQDNWDLSVKRATSVVRILQNDYKIDPNKLIAAGRGQYNALTSNDTPQGRSINRRTRIIILPKLNQFYDLLKPDKE